MENISEDLEKVFFDDFKKNNPEEAKRIEEIAGNPDKALEFFKDKSVLGIIHLVYKTLEGNEENELSKSFINTPEQKIDFATYTLAHYWIVLSEKLDQVFKQIESIKNFIDKDKDPDLFLMVEHLKDLINYL